MLNISRLFAKSPFSPLQTHMEKVHACIKKLEEIVSNLTELDIESLSIKAEELSKLEHEADLTKNDIRNQLPKSIFLAIDRSQILEILSIQDSIAGKAEEISQLLTIKKLAQLNFLTNDLSIFFAKNMEAFFEVYHIMKEMDNLLESSFGGLEAKKVSLMVDQTAYKEYESDVLKRKILKTFFNNSTTLTPPDFYLWMKFIEEVGSISHICEQLAMRIKNLLDLN